MSTAEKAQLFLKELKQLTAKYGVKFDYMGHGDFDECSVWLVDEEGASLTCDIDWEELKADPWVNHQYGPRQLPGRFST